MITRADRTLVSKQIEAEVRNYFGPLVYDRVVPTSVKFREAYARGVPLVNYDRFSPGAEAYRAAARAFLEGAAGSPRRLSDQHSAMQLSGEGTPETRRLSHERWPRG